MKFFRESSKRLKAESISGNRSIVDVPYVFIFSEKRKNEEQKNILFGLILQSYIVHFYFEHLFAAASLTIS